MTQAVALVNQMIRNSMGYTVDPIIRTEDGGFAENPDLSHAQRTTERRPINQELFEQSLSQLRLNPTTEITEARSPTQQIAHAPIPQQVPQQTVTSVSQYQSSAPPTSEPARRRSVLRRILRPSSQQHQGSPTL